MKKKAVIIGAGPAGLTAAYELLKRSDQYEVTVLEATNQIGGISRTVNHNGNRMDMGGHRFFSKNEEVNRWWEEMLPLQGKPAYDDALLHRSPSIHAGGPDPEKEDRVMLSRSRLSRIFFRGKFFDYPVSLKWETVRNMGLWTTIQVGFSYIKSAVFPRKENSLEDFYINRFGRKLYEMFFERYTENLWGRHPSEISPEWGAQRVKGLSILAVLKDMLSKVFHIQQKKVETSLIEEFHYPKYGPGQLWEVTAQEIRHLGGTVLMESEVNGLKMENGCVVEVRFQDAAGEQTICPDVVISSMPIKDLVGAMDEAPQEMRTIASGLPYRDYMTVGVLVPQLELENKTKLPTLGKLVPDNWVYVHDRSVSMGRFQIYNNWSPYLVKDCANTVWVGLEYFCNEGDEMWNMSDEDFAQMGFREMVTIGLIKDVSCVLDSHVERVKKAYPAYFDTYAQMDELREWLDTIDNLYCVGRNGQHRYNNIDHSMVTSFEVVNNLLTGVRDRSNIWNVNTESEYHEGGKETVEQKA